MPPLSTSDSGLAQIPEWNPRRECDSLVPMPKNPGGGGGGIKASFWPRSSTHCNPSLQQVELDEQEESCALDGHSRENGP